MAKHRANTDRIAYAFGHLVASFNPEDPHHAASGELAGDVLMEALGSDEGAMEIIGALTVVAEHVAGNYTYTGAAEDFIRRVKAGEV